MTKKILEWSEVKKIAEEVAASDEDYQPDGWQKKVLEHDGNIAMRTGRQVGKSTTIAKKCNRIATSYSKITILMIAAAQRQSSEIFQKTLRDLNKIHEGMLKRVGRFRPNPNLSPRQNDDARRKFEHHFGIFENLPTKTEVTLKNGVRILSLPTGKTGAFVRCYTVDVLIADEAAYIAEPVWLAVKPMLATSKKMRGLGWEILLSTPFGKGGHYYNCCHDPDFLQISVSSESCRRISPDFLRKERLRLSKMEYAQEYLGEFVSEFNQLFPTELIKDRMTFIEWNSDLYSIKRKYYLGVDIARYGADENAFIVAELDANNHLRVVYVLTTERKSLTDTVGRIIVLDEMFRFNRIFTDDSGVGGGVTDSLIEKLGKRKVFGINNATKTVDETKQKGILKEDLYSNALVLMERKHIDIIANLKLQRSLKSITYEYTSNANLKIFGKYSHLAEAFVRACWCVKAKGLNLFIA